MDLYDDTYWVSKVKFVQGSLEQAKSMVEVLTLNWKNIKYRLKKQYLIELFKPSIMCISN